MKAISLTTLGLILLTFSSCGSKNKVSHVGGFAVDSVVLDTVVSLTSAENAPTCELKLHLHFLKEEKATALNDTLLRAGILTPDYFSLNKEKLSVKNLVDSFARRYLEEYLEEYAPLYRADTEHASAYNVKYFVQTHFEESADDILTNIANVYTFGGGAHGIKQTLALNIDTKKARIIRLSDLFKDANDRKLKEVVMAQMQKDFEVESFEQLQEKGIFTNGDTYLSENFILAADEITFIYGEDEIAPHSVGEIRVKMEKDKLSDYLK
ncbi:MAG: RsiV family protein [Prevotella sp.]|nr:RsiV family protein [Prevotella sp.]